MSYSIGEAEGVSRRDERGENENLKMSIISIISSCIALSSILSCSHRAILLHRTSDNGKPSSLLMRRSNQRSGIASNPECAN